MEKNIKDNEYCPSEKEFPRKYIEEPEESHEDNCECLNEKENSNLWKEKATDILKQVGWVIGKATFISGIGVVGMSILPSLLGFTNRGVAARSLAAMYQRRFLRGAIVKGSLFSVLQRHGVKGIATTTKKNFGFVVFIICLVFFTLLNKNENRRQSSSIKGNKKKCTCKRSQIETKKIL